MSAKLKTSGVFLALALGSVLAIHQAGCLSPQQQADVAAYSQQLDKDQGVVLDVQAELAKYSADMKAVLADVEAGKLPVASGKALVIKLLANQDAARAKLGAALASVDATKASLDALKKSGTPWWAYAIPTGLTLAQLLGTFVPQLSFLVPIAGALKGQLAGAQTKLATTQEVAGSLSRTLDTLAPKGAVTTCPSLGDQKEWLLLREQQGDELATKRDYDELRSLAKAGQI